MSRAKQSDELIACRDTREDAERKCIFGRLVAGMAGPSGAKQHKRA